MSAAPPSAARLPAQIPFIVGSEGCERFSFYGMRNLLTTFLATTLLLDLPEAAREPAAKEVFHTFVIGVYFFPLLGGWLADRVLGKYRTILWLSVVYTAGHALLAGFEHQRLGFYTGLALIALGSGGIKPCVSTFVGDQFDASNKHLAKRVFDAFYWIVNFGSFFATLLAPALLSRYGPSVAFGVPGVLMALATLILWLGRDRYVRVPPRREADPDGFGAVARTALARDPAATGLATLGGLGAGAAVAGIAAGALAPVPGLCLALVSVLGLGGAGVAKGLGAARGHHPEGAVEGARAVLRLLGLFALVTPFWSLFDQKASTWLFQAQQMTKPAWFHPAQMQALNPALVMLLIPVASGLGYPLARRLGVEPTPLRRIGAGLALSGLSWVVVAGLQVALDRGVPLSVAWQVLPYAILTLGEVLVSTTGLEFAYSQAPPGMKGTLMSGWSLAVTVGNLWVLLVNAAVRSPSVEAALAAGGYGVAAPQMLFFALFAFAAAGAWAAAARRYPLVEHWRPA